MMTKKNFFEQIVSLSLSDEMTEFAQHQLESLSKPTAPTAQQKENAVLKIDVIEILKDAGVPMEVEGIRAALNAMRPEWFETAPLSSQRVSALLSQLTKAEQIVRIAPKGKSKVTFTAK